MTDFSFEANQKYNKYSSRAWRKLNEYTLGFLILIAFLLICTFITNEQVRYYLPTFEWYVYLSFLILIYRATSGLFRVTNYITKFIYNNNIITIEHLHYNTLTIYSGKSTDFEIQKKSSLILGNGFKTIKYLQIKSLKNGTIIKQYEVFDWNEKVMDNLMLTLKEPDSPLTP
jgi:hypothetical protein